jgi:hypothetical protein
VNQNEKQHAIPVCITVPKDVIRYVKFFRDKRRPAVITFPHASYDVSYYLLYNQFMIPSMAPEPQSMPYFNGLRRFIPVPIENVVEDTRNCIGPESRMGHIEAGDAGDESTSSN